jgi:DNA polymerase elongation subunit (family B)
LRFYTNVKLIGNHIFHRGYDDEVEVKEKIKYEPTLYIPSNKKTKYLTLDNKYVSPIKPGTVSDTRKFVEKYKDVEGFEYYGNTNPTYQFISDEYPEEVIDFDINQIKLYVLDIETTAEQGTIDAIAAKEEILLITIQDYASKEIITWGSRTFTERVENHTYIECENEAELLQSFLDFWENNYPDVVTGWNISGYDIPYI